MDPREFPTKGNLMLAKNSLMLARQGYDLMDKKRNILLKELMGLIEDAEEADIPLPQNKKKKQKDKIQEAEKNEQDKNKICT